MNTFIDAYLNIITEAWDRFDYYDIIKAVKNITNECKDAWVKGETSSKVLALLKQSGAHKRGNERIRHSTLLDENDYEIIANDDTYITMYWKGKSKSGSEFDNSAFRSIWTYCSANEYRKSDVIAQEVGKLAYAVWKALNSRNNKIEKNLKEFDEKGFDYQEGQKVENLDLIIKDVVTVVTNYRGIGAHFADSTELVCEDPTSGFKYKVRLGKNTSKAVADLFAKIKRDGKLEEFKSKLGLDKINISGKILRINKEYKSVTMNFVTINYPTDAEVKSMENQYFEMKKQEEENAKTTSKISEYIEFIRTCVNVCKKDPTLKDNEALVNMVKQYVDYLNLDEIYEILNDYQKNIVKETEEIFIS